MSGPPEYLLQSPQHGLFHKALAPVTVFWCLWDTLGGVVGNLCFFLWRFGRAWLSFPACHTGLCPAPGAHPGLGASLLPHCHRRAELMGGGTSINLVRGEQHQCRATGISLGKRQRGALGLFQDAQVSVLLEGLCPVRIQAPLCSPGLPPAQK